MNCFVSARDSEVSGKSPYVRLAACTVAFRHASEGVNDLLGIVGERPFSLTWIPDFRPLVFACVGISEQEPGRWGLLAQCARNEGWKHLVLEAGELVR